MYAVMGRARLDDNSQANTGFVTIGDASHWLEIDWKQSSGPDANDGFLHLWIDGAPVGSRTNLDNNAGTVDFVRLGALSVKAGASGTMYFDEFVSRDDNYIGPSAGRVRPVAPVSSGRGRARRRGCAGAPGRRGTSR